MVPILALHLGVAPHNNRTARGLRELLEITLAVDVCPFCEGACTHQAMPGGHRTASARRFPLGG